ncbi:MAG: hypothetical protein E7573_04450 [Ruminococcaceae bacterium]|nr:hypothetical protein [Oscillospiraceae bacterium]
MFCANCGNKMEDSMSVCPACNFRVIKNDFPPSVNNYQQTANNYQRPANNYHPPVNHYQQTANNYQPPVNHYQQPVNNYRPPVNNYNPPVTMSASEKKAKKKGKKIAVAVISLVLVLLLILSGVGIVIGVSIYKNSDSYKISQAESLMEEERFEEAQDLLAGVTVPSGIGLREFINVEKSAVAFVEKMEESFPEFSEVCDVYIEFGDAIDAFAESYGNIILPEKANEKYMCYSAAFTFTADISVSSSYGETLFDAIYDIQQVLLNPVERNKTSEYGDSFTLRKMQERVDISKEAKEVLNGYSFPEIEVNDDSVKMYCKTQKGSDGITDCVYASEFFKTNFDILISSCSIEIYNEQDTIDETLEEYTYDEELYLVSPEDDYTFFISTFYLSVGSEDDIETNQSMILTVLITDVMYSLLTGNTSDNAYY